MDSDYLAAIVNSTDDAIIGKDLDGTITSWNRAATRIFGYAADEALGRSITMLLPPDRLHEEELIIARIRRGERVDHFETVRRGSNGLDIHVSLTISPIRGPGGAIIGASKIARDIGRRRRIEHDLLESRRRSDELLALLDTLQSSAPIGVGFMDRAYRYIRVNEALAAINGVPVQDHIGRTVPELVPHVWPQIEPVYRAVLEEGKSIVNMEMHGVTAGAPNEQREWLVSLYPVKMQDDIFGIGAIVVDITDRNRTQKQLIQAQKMEAVGTLTGGLAHDFNNLLGVIIGNLDMLHDSKATTADDDELISEALGAAERGAALTRSLLSFARRQPLAPTHVKPNDLIAEIVTLLCRLLGEQIEISLDLAPDVWPVVVDPVQLQTSLTNLATNARDAMPDGGKILITTRNRKLDANYVVLHPEVAVGDYTMIEVSDTGPGMAPEVMSQIFDPFFTTKEEGKGTGLGLSMVFGFMKQSCGHINVYSEVGHGTTFRLYLPRSSRLPIPRPMRRLTIAHSPAATSACWSSRTMRRCVASSFGSSRNLAIRCSKRSARQRQSR